MARDALALADHLELDSFHLLGMSMGGAIAQEVALQAPDRLRTLTLVVTFGGGGNWSVERAEEFNELVLGWLRANAGPSDPQARRSAQPTPS